jgi:hypothetical protein
MKDLHQVKYEHWCVWLLRYRFWYRFLTNFRLEFGRGLVVWYFCLSYYIYTKYYKNNVDCIINNAMKMSTISSVCIGVPNSCVWWMYSILLTDGKYMVCINIHCIFCFTILKMHLYTVNSNTFIILGFVIVPSNM